MGRVILSRVIYQDGAENGFEKIDDI